MAASTPQQQLRFFLSKYEPAIARQASEAIDAMRARLPGAVEVIYDNYNALAVGWGPTDRRSDVICSIAVFPRWVSLFFFQGTKLADPQKLLKGKGTQVRHIVLDGTAMLESPGVKALITQAIRIHPTRIDRQAKGQTIVKSISARQRPRRPGRKTS
jgi:hypothetical protein